MLEQILTNIGLSIKEAKVYLSCLRLGNAPVSAIARAVTQQRVTTYAILKNLVSKGYIQQLKQNKVTMYSAISPSMLLNKQQEKYTRLESSIPELEAIKESYGLQPKVQFFQWSQDVEELYLDTLQTSQNIYSFQNLSIISPSLKEFLYKKYMPRRIKSKIKAYVILPDFKENRLYAESKKKLSKETLLIQKIPFDIPCQILLYQEQKVMIVLFSQNHPSAILIQSKDVYTTIKLLFDLLRSTFTH